MMCRVPSASLLPIFSGAAPTNVSTVPAINEVVASPPIQPVEAVATEDAIATRPPVDHVLSFAAIDGVVATFAKDEVVAQERIEADDRVVTAAAADLVRETRRVQLIVARRSHDGACVGVPPVEIDAGRP